MATRYSIIGSSRRARLLNTNINSNTEIKVVDDFKEDLEASADASPFEPENSDDLTNLFRTAQSVEIKLRTDDNGNDRNQVVVILPNGKKFSRCRIYGSDKELVPEQVFTSDEIANLTWGYCRQDGEYVREVSTKTDGTRVMTKVKYLMLNA